MVKKIVHLWLCAGLLFFPGPYVDAYRGDESFQNYRQPSFQPDFQPDYQRHLNLDRYSNPLSLNIRSWTKPDLDINMWSMKLPAIQVRDIGNSVWTYEKLDNHFNAEFKAYDHYAANIHFNFSGVQAPNQIQMEMGKMKFGEGSLIPQSYRKVYQDKIGNSFMRERTGQFGSMNDKYNTFVQYYERQGQLARLGPTSGVAGSRRPPAPTQELVEGFRENWRMAVKTPDGTRRTSTTLIHIDAIEHETNLSRFISGYGGSVRSGGETIFFKVASPTDMNGNIQSLEIEMWGMGTPKAKISWEPVEGVDGNEAFSLLRKNLPVPLLIGPNAGLRFNGTDLPETHLNVTKEGTLTENQIGKVKDIANLIGKESLGIETSFSPPSEDLKAGFSLKNAFRNLWYMVTGRWSEVKSLRQDLTAMQKNDPARFVLTAGFNDPSFMGIKDLRNATNNSKHLSPQLLKSASNILDQVPAVGLYINDKGNEIYRAASGREINVTHLKELTSFTQQSLVPSLGKEATALKEVFSELSEVVKGSQASLKNRNNIALAKEPGTIGAIKRFFFGAGESPAPVAKDSFQGLDKGLKLMDQRLTAQENFVNSQVTATHDAVQNGDYESAANHIAQAFEAAIAEKAIYSEVTQGISTLKESFQQLTSAQKYTSGHADAVPPAQITAEDLARVENPFFASDPDVIKTQGAVMQSAPEGSQAVATLYGLGLIDKKTADQIQFQLSTKQKDVIRGFSNLDKLSSSRVMSAVQMAQATEDIIGGVVLGATMEKESTLSVAAGTMVYFTPLGAYAIARDLLAEAYKGRLGEDLTGAIMGSYIPEDKLSPSSLRGIMLGYVASLGLSAARDATHAMGTLASTKFADGKMELALAMLPFFATEAKVAKGIRVSLSEFRELSTFTRVGLQESKLAVLKATVSDLAASRKNPALLARLERKIDAVDGLVNKLKGRTIADLRNIPADFKIVRRAGLPERSLYESWIKGQLKDEEWNALRGYAMKTKKDIPISGSLTETDLGMSRRYELLAKPESKGQLVERYGIAKYRANKPNSDLIDLGFGDVDIYAGSTLSTAEKEYILIEIFKGMEKRLDQGYSVNRYRSVGKLEGRAGALIFRADGTVQRLPANWQKEFLR